MMHIAYAAAHVARELHKGQKDKGGCDYFRSHLLKVGSSGIDWKEQVVGFLHDAAEDTDYDVDTVVSLVKAKMEEWLSHPQDTSWMDDFRDDIMPSTDEQDHLPTDEEWQEIATALYLLDKHTVPTREEYISRISNNRLALKVKLNDLRNNMDISRIPNPTEKDFARLERYKKEYEQLIRKLNEQWN